jgi:hypothetical protein
MFTRRTFLKLFGAALAVPHVNLYASVPVISAKPDPMSEYIDYVAMSDLFPLHPYMTYDVLNDPEAGQVDMSLLYKYKMDSETQES